ncbi:hypothetical protein G1C94_1379 [Bifidobacterium sp. DSM 109963]|uniref:Uncharacterized protein n=1 Tax=Bifidobacterium panos TaxID=2675321 RepID=A0ABX1SZZ7_9BIFI|nr:hypothetical protein [Bifidobacterium sp. DSM 109963]
MMSRQIAPQAAGNQKNAPIDVKTIKTGVFPR